MDYNYEQTVSAVPSRRSGFLLALAWTGIAALVLLAVVFAAGIFGTDAEGGFAVSWLSVICLVICLAAAVLILRLKDRLRLEYDYVIRDGQLEVTAVLNNRRRVPKLRLQLGRILACGQGNPPAGQLEKLYLNPDAKLTYVCYEQQGENRCALLELNDDMAMLLKSNRELQRGAWRE